MAGTLEQLFFTITLLDKVSGPSKGVCESFRAMQQQGKDAFQLMGKGALGLTTAAVGLNAFTGPARDFSKSLGEVESLGVPVAELDQLETASKRFARQFGGDAAEIVRSAYDIQSAIPGLTDGALAAFTVQGNLLAKATKATSGEITAYQGQMYNIFKDEAQKMGDARWIDQLTGKTAKAVEMFMTTGPKMKQAFANLGSVGKLMGVSMDEQIAVLGTLQSAGMSDANAGTAYKAMLSQMNTASQVLKLNFKGEDGNLLPMYEMIDKIQGKIGNLDKDQQVAQLAKAFGQDGAKAVMNMMGNTDALKQSIQDIAKIQDSSGAVKMAKSMVDPYDQFLATMKVLRITLGQGVLPVVNLVLGVISKVMAAVIWFVDTIPGLKYVIGAVVIAVSALTMALSGFYLVIGGKRLLRAFHEELKIVWQWCLKNAAATDAMTASERINAVTKMLWTKATGGSIIVSKLAAGAQWLYSASLRSGVFWQKMGAVWSTTLAICTGRQTAQTALATAATGGLSMAQLGLIVKEKALVLWTGITKAATIGLNIAMAALKLVMLAGVVPAAMAAGAGILAMKIPMLLAAGVSWIMSGGLVAATAATWAFTVALLACPVTWIVLAIVALAGGLVALIYYWDEVCAFCQKYADYLLMMLGPIGWVIAAFRNWDKISEVLQNVWGWFKKTFPNIAGLIEKLVTIAVNNVKFAIGFWKDIFTGAYDWIVGKFSAIGDFFAGVWDSITAAGTGFYEWLGGKLLPLVQFFSDAFAGAGNIAAAIWGGIQSALGKVDGWIGSILRGLSKIPGLGILSPDVDTSGNPVAVPAGTAAAAAVAPPAAEPVISDVVKTRDYDVPAGGVRNSTVNNNRNYNVEVYAPNGLSPAQLEEYLILQGA